jgi:hypothetical protein
VLQRALSGVHSIAGAASAYGTAFWASAGLTAMAIAPCFILLRAERRARAERGKQAAASAEMSEAIAA